MPKKILTYSTSSIAALIACIALIGCDTANKTKTEQHTSSQTTQVAPPSKNWYKGGTLHKANGLEWQTAEYNNKLATCADFITMMHNQKQLKKEISFKIKSTDDIFPLAKELVAGLDEEFKNNPDPAENERLFADQKVTSTTVMFVAAKGWIAN